MFDRDEARTPHLPIRATAHIATRPNSLTLSTDRRTYGSVLFVNRVKTVIFRILDHMMYDISGHISFCAITSYPISVLSLSLPYREIATDSRYCLGN